MSVEKLPPWHRKRPRVGKRAPLTAYQKAAARARALEAGRRYPNLVDNMWAAAHVPPGPSGAGFTGDSPLDGG